MLTSVSTNRFSALMAHFLTYGLFSNTSSMGENINSRSQTLISVYYDILRQDFDVKTIILIKSNKFSLNAVTLKNL
jgi:hypothetical protein